MAVILNLAMLDSYTAILYSNTLLSSLRFTQKLSHSTLTLTQTNSIQLTRWWQPSWILPSWIQPFCTKNFPSSFWLNFIMAVILNSVILDSAILHKINFTHSFWLNLMMTAILNSAMLDSYTAILDSNTLLSSLRFTQEHSHSTLTLTQTNSIQLTRWWQPSWILPSYIQPSWIQPFCTKLWLKLVQSDSNSFILTQLDDGSHLEFGHVGFSHHSYSSQTHSHVPRLVPNNCTKKKVHSFIFTQLDDGSHPELCHVGFRHCHPGFRHLVIFSQIHSKALSLHSDSDSN